MQKIDFKKPTNVYFCGIGGISMSGLATVLLDKGFNVSGSDRSESELTETLRKAGAKIFIGQKSENITDDIKVFVYTAAIHTDHPEYKRAVELGIPVMTRAELLGLLMKNYELPIAISGTHGKTTVTAMITQILLEADKDPTVSIGGMLDSIGGNFRIGHSDYFVTEACEYTNSFLSFFPKATIILNIEEDHLDFFKDINDIRNSFHRFAKLTPENGVIIIGNDIPDKDEITEGTTCPVISFGHGNDADYHPENIVFDKNGSTHFTAVSPGGIKEDFVLNVPGEHNVTNALCAIAFADFLNIERSVTFEALKAFGGTKRRFEKKGEVNGVSIVDDYAHHPSEIRATLTAAQNIPKNKLWCVFQPHTYSRTKAFMDDFAKALSLSDAVILADIYAARETDDLGISSKDLRDLIEKLGTESYYFPSFEEIEKFISEKCSPGDMLITMGAGDVVNIADDLVKK
ncbi:MAG: UDP-N-acetylmuramate--L-alanine ligase [Lachnospiraceae bacterium]|nr:UDP-N-acetylmuramate--L-alanine ligase [Lachnospiraceae bacterium]